MGSAVVTEVLGHGGYMVRPVPDAGVAEVRLPQIEARLEELPDLMEQAQLELEAAQDTYRERMGQLNEALQGIHEGTVTEQQVLAARDRYEDARRDVSRKMAARAQYMAENTSLEREREAIQEAAEMEPRQAWCADYTVDLPVGEVTGTIEINGTPDHILVHPGGDDGIGAVQATRNSTSAGVFYNWALMPWWQRWQPTYRTGVITAIDKDQDTCTVSLDAATSSMNINSEGEPIDGHSINPENQTLQNVPIAYMDCNSQPFDIASHVVVLFIEQDWDRPLVIGFVEEPQPCGLGIPLQFFNVTNSMQMVSLATNRINELNQFKAHANHCKDVFIPAVLSYYNGLKGMIYFISGVMQDIDEWGDQE